MDVASAGGEFLIFTTNEELELYSDSNCFDCVDESDFLLLPTEINENRKSDNHKTPTLKVSNLEVIFDSSN